MNPIPETRIVGVDYGRKRTGLALSDIDCRIASPAGAIRARGLDDLAARIGDFARENAASSVVLGLPRHMDGRPGELAAEVERLAGLLESRGLRVILRDERLTSWDAAQRIRESGGPRPSKERIDAASAALLLQDYLDEASR